MNDSELWSLVWRVSVKQALASEGHAASATQGDADDDAHKPSVISLIARFGESAFGKINEK